MSVDPRSRLYEPRGACRELWTRRDPELLIAGPAGTGKSRACLEKLNAAALRYPGMRGLMARKTREALTQSALVTMSQHVLPEGWLDDEVTFRVTEQEFRYRNGSVIVVGGLDKPSKIMSTDYDMAYVQEATELAEADWETIISRLRNGVMPYQQLIADCNPQAPTHWLKKRCDRGQTAMLLSRHEDNPIYHDGKRWTKKGTEYLEKLSSLTGVRRLRLLEGRWAAAEGLVYEGWDPAVHLIDELPEGSEGWTRYWSVDFALTHAMVWQAWAIDGDGRAYMYHEIHKTGLLVEDLAKLILEVTKDEPRPRSIVCDPADAGGRGTLERHMPGLFTSGARKDVLAGIQAVASRLRLQKDGRPRLYLCRNALIERDLTLQEAGKPCSTAEEFESYVWAKESGKLSKERPEKRDDDGMDALRYLVAQLDLVGEASYGPEVWP